MEDFARLFGGLLTFTYHCFDRIVIRGHLPLLIRPENIVHFFRDVHGVAPITKEVLRQRSSDYQQWVADFARKRKIPVEWAKKGVRKEDYVRPWLQQMERQGRYGVFYPQEHGTRDHFPLGGTVPHRRSQLPHSGP